MAVTARDTALITADEFRIYYWGDTVKAGTTNDARIAQLVPLVSGEVSDYCSRKFARDVYDEIVNGYGGRFVQTTHWPIQSVTNLWESPNGVWTDPYLLVQRTTDGTGDFAFLPGEAGQGRIERLGSAATFGGMLDAAPDVFSLSTLGRSGVGFARGQGNIREQYVGGYGTPTPAAPVLSVASTSGGTVPAGTYYAVATYNGADGEWNVSPQSASLATTGSTSQIHAASPAAETGALTWNLYVGTSQGGPWYRAASAVAIGTAVTLTSAPTSGATPPVSPIPGPVRLATLELMAIEFQLAEKRLAMTVSEALPAGGGTVTYKPDEARKRAFSRLDSFRRLSY